MKTKVKFYYEKAYQKGMKINSVFAYFPDESNFDSNGNKMCYSRLGQHSACSPAYVAECKQVKRASKYADLKQELESIGYDLEVI
jgi:hypothetical protein